MTVVQDFNDKVALVTGGASGIGQACVEEFAKRGANVVIADLNQELGDALVAKLEAHGTKALFVKTDVSDHDSVKNMVAQTMKIFGKLDFAVNNAGIEGARTPLHLSDVDNWKLVMDVDLNGVYYCMREQIGAMLSGGSKECAIVNMASMMGLVGAPTVGAYVAAKHAVIGLTKSAALEYSAQGIRVNAVCPGYIETPMTAASIPPEMKQRLLMMHPIGRLGAPENVAQSVAYLCSTQSSFVTGTAHQVDGGYTCH